MKKLCVTTIKNVVAVVDYDNFETACSDGKFRSSSDVIEMVKHHIPPYDKYEVKPFKRKIYFYKFTDIITVSDEKA